ncbi:MAG: aldehyde dehydrogenase EutE [Tenericutes bacterium]|nr:aldehyde dehydrogenase EutE [Mycoplasmatota bacterium]
MSTNDLIKKITAEMEQKYGDNKTFIQTHDLKHENNTRSIQTNSTKYIGVFENVEDAIIAAKKSQEQLMELSMKKRNEIIAAMRKTSLENAEKLAIMAHEETGFGRIEDKTIKNILAAEKTPGTEDLHASTFTGDDGMTLVELAPFGVIGSITPSTNPSSTIINNGISMVAAGNSVVFNPHPSAKKVTCESISLLNKAIHDVGGPSELLTAPLNPTLESSKVIMTHEDVRILVVTGGEAVVGVAMKSGKKVIAAGPGNPPVIVDDTANIKKAANDIVRGASFDNNILCTAEKEAFVLNSVFTELRNEMVKNGAYELKRHEIEIVANEVLAKNSEGKTIYNKNYVGKSALEILKACGISAPQDCKLIIAEVTENHPFITVEMLMPVLGIVRVYTVDEAIEKAVIAENGNLHTAVMHSESVSNLTKAARALKTSIFVKNAPSFAGLGIEGEGFTTLTIATPTGEGLTSAKSFSRIRRCTLSGGFRIV